MRYRAVLAGCVLAGLSALPSGAGELDGGEFGSDEFDNTVLLSEGVWTVRHTYDSRDGGSWCAADTSNDAGQWFSVTAYEQGAAAILVGDPRWRLAPRDMSFRIDVDHAGWDMLGAGQDDAVSVLLNSDAHAPDLLMSLMQGSALAVYSDRGRRLADFSLDGSDAALRGLLECWSMIDRSGETWGPADPFGASASDPV